MPSTSSDSSASSPLSTPAEPALLALWLAEPRVDGWSTASRVSKKELGISPSDPTGSSGSVGRSGGGLGVGGGPSS